MTEFRPGTSRKPRHDSKTIRMKYSGINGTAGDNGRYYRCWNCSYICKVGRERLGDAGLDGHPFPTYVDHFDNDDWAVSGSKGSWYQGQKWKSATYVDGTTKTGIVLDVNGTWFTSYRPTKVIVSHTLGNLTATYTATIKDDSAVTVNQATLDAGSQVALTFAGTDNIAQLSFETSGTTAPFYITNIEFYEPATATSGCPLCGTLNWRGDL